MNWIVMLIVSLAAESLQPLMLLSPTDYVQDQNGSILVIANASIMFLDIPDEYYIILSEGQEYRIDTRARISFDQSLEIDAELSILGIGVLTIKYIELDDSGYFRYRIMNYGREIRFTPIGYVRDYLDREDLEGSISRNRYEIVGTIVKNAFGEETYRKFLGVTILDVHGVSIRR